MIARTRTQAGVTTLVVAMVLLIAATFITFFAAKVGVQGQRMSANDYRYKQGFNSAEALLERAKVFLASDRSNFSSWGWTACIATQTSLPCGDGNQNRFDATWSWVDVSARDANAVAGLDWNSGDGPYILTQNTSDSFSPVVLAARGRSDDDSGLALVRVSQSRFNLLNPGPVPPLMAPSINLGGAFNIVGNPDYKRNAFDLTLNNCDSQLQDSGVPLSVWSRNEVNADTSGTANWRTCLSGDFRRSSDEYGSIGPQPCFLGTVNNGCGCQPSGSTDSPYSGKDAQAQAECPTAIPGEQVVINCDIVQEDPNFPGDPFQYVFGRSPELVKSQADQVLTSCDTLGPGSSGLIWVEGGCDLAGAGSPIGSRTTPVVLVVANGAIKFPADSDFWGMVVGHNVTEVQINGTFTLHGAMVVDNDVANLFKGSGTYNAVYDPCVFAAMGAGTPFDKFGPVAGSWNDRF